MKRSKCPMRRSELQRESSMILTTNSRAGCDIAWAPSPRPYHRPVHHALLVSSCLNSRDKNTAMRILCIALWMAMTAIRPSTACEASQSSRNHCKADKQRGQGRWIIAYQEFEETDHSNNAKNMGYSSHPCTKPWINRI